MYRVIVGHSAENELKRLSPEVRVRVAPAIRALATNPRPAGCRKLVGSESDRKTFADVRAKSGEPIAVFHAGPRILSVDRSEPLGF